MGDLRAFCTMEETFRLCTLNGNTFCGFHIRLVGPRVPCSGCGTVITVGSTVGSVPVANRRVFRFGGLGSS